MPSSAPSFAVSGAGVNRTDRLHRTRMPAMEKILVAVSGVNLVMISWAFGGADAWSQLLAASLGLLALGLALGPRSGQVYAPGRALRRFPIFWTGLVLFGYVLVQWANPAFVYRNSGREWWLEALPHLRWLPSGMVIPFADAGPLRGLLLGFAPWATTCALWIGLTRRSSILTLLNIVAANGFLLAAFGLVQLAAGKGDIYGVRHTEGAEIFASFIYRNHAAAYFYLVATIAAALTLHGLWRSRAAKAARHGPAILHGLFATTALAAVVLTCSLGGAILLFASWGLLGTVTLARFLRPLGAARISWPGVSVALACFLLVGVLAAFSGREPVVAHLRLKLAGGAQTSLRSRLLVDRRGGEMWRDRPLLGWGAGCFRYGFTKYQRREIAITGAAPARHFWEHAHNDWLELLIELGLLGIIPVVVGAIAWIRLLWREKFWDRPHLLWGATGVVTLAAYGLVDFPLQNPAVLLTAACALCLLVRWGELY